MFETARFAIAADRFTPRIDAIDLHGYDLTGAVFKMQVRDRKDGGTVRADLTTVATAGAEGVRLIYAGTALVSAHVAAGRLTTQQVADYGYASGDTLAITQIGYRINESTMEAMPGAAEAGSDVPIYWDMHVSPSGGTKFVAFAGEFTVLAGVTE